MSSVEQETSTVSPGQGATGEEELRTVTRQVVYPQRTLDIFNNFSVHIFSNTFYYRTHRVEMDK